MLLALAPSTAQADDVWSPACIEYVSLSTYVADCSDCGDCSADSLCRDGCYDAWYGDGLTLFAGIEGSKQPQDFGVNANLGGRVRANYAAPLWQEHGIGFQVGTAINSTANAVRVYELVGEETDRFQSFTSLGLFQRTDSGWFWGFTYDYLYQESFDEFDLSQWRVRLGKRVSHYTELGVTAHISDASDTGVFNGLTTETVTLEPITQGSAYWRTFWESGAQTTVWAGLAEGHGENNAVTGASLAQDTVFVFGADVFAPLNDCMAIYGETNLMMPADTGTVDAYLGLEFYPWGGAYQGRRTRYSSLLPVASSTSMSVDLVQ